MLCLLVLRSGLISLQRGALHGSGSDRKWAGIIRTQAAPATLKASSQVRRLRLEACGDIFGFLK